MCRYKYCTTIRHRAPPINMSSSASNSSATVNETVNFMGGKSFKLDPLQSLKVVCTSIICGESQYYRRAGSKGVKDSAKFLDHFLFPEFYDESESATDYFEKIVSDALDHDFEGCLQFVSKLRNEYLMRLNSNYLLAVSAHHPKRAEFNKANPKVFKTAIEQVGCIPTDWTTQYKLLKESGKPIPTIWKRAIADKLHNMSAYHAAKYLHGSKTKGKVAKAKMVPRPNVLPVDEPELEEGEIREEAPIADAVEEVPVVEKDSTLEEAPIADAVGEENTKKRSLANLVDLIRITHPKPTAVINQLVKTGKVVVADDEQTWEKLRSAKKTWQEINAQIRLPHMALLRNLRNILEEYATRPDTEEALAEIELLAEQLVKGVKGGKQFPFRYFSAYKMLKSAGNERGDSEYASRGHFKGKKTEEDKPRLTQEQQLVFNKMRDVFLSGLNQCVLESVESIPPMNGRVECLSDNSGSSRGGMVSEYGSVLVYEIANLSAILTAYRATCGGNVWVFGDRLEKYAVTKKPILEQLEEVNALGNTVGEGTETGIWLFWEKFIENAVHTDNVFIYSDMQAGTGGLYVDGLNMPKLQKMGAAIENGTYVDVLKLVQIYRERVCPKVNVFSVQVAGYDNTVLPDILYRGAILSGWTGKEARLAYEMSTLWDEIESPKPKEQEPKEQEPKELEPNAEEDDEWVSEW